MNLRTLPPVCLLTALYGLVTGRLVISDEYVGTQVRTGVRNTSRVFRHIRRCTAPGSGSVLTVHFRFKRFSYAVNRFISRIPMLLIAGFPGFVAKMYAVESGTGYWTGIYQWESEAALQAYKRSFVLSMMNRRAAKGTVTYRIINDYHIAAFLKENNVTDSRQPSPALI